MPTSRAAMRTRIRATFTDSHFGWAILGAVVLWAVGIVWFEPRPDPFWPLNRPRDALFLGVLYPVIEEWLFRGMVQGTLRRRPAFARTYAGVTPANLITSSLFTALHFISHPPLAAAAVLIPSLVFGHFRDRHGNLLAPILLHMFYNTGYFWLFASGN